MELYANILGKGKPFVILHGFLGMGDNWKTLGQDFSEQGYQVHLLDQRNHGRSFHDETFNYEAMVEDLRHYCDTNQLNQIVLLGHSMGGKTAMLFAATYPERVAKLIIADISPRFYPVHHDVILEGLMHLDNTNLTSRTQADELLKQHISDSRIRQFLLKNLYRKTKDKLVLRLNIPVLKNKVAEVGEAIPNQARYSGNTLFLRGDRSEYIGDQDEGIIKTHFPNAAIQTIPNAGHWLHAENPTDFFNAVMQFLKA
ncbi:MAG TPA: alpha/beta fold hydrolase [Flavobacteriaceae bacterium]|nr:alpha/beta fold hydrolase [Flavobacteriaceae bacterium]